MTMHYLIFDIKWVTEADHPVYLETGSAIYSQLLPSTMEKVWDHLLEKFSHKKIYIDILSVVPEKYQSKVTSINYPHNSDETLLHKIISGQLVKGVFIFSNVHDVTTAYEFKLKHNLDKLIIINGNSMISALNKVPFYEYCQHAEMAYPPTWLISPRTFSYWQTSPEKLAVHPDNTPAPITSASGWIIKPPDSCRGEGAAFCTDEQLPAVLTYLNNRNTPCPLKDEPLFSDFWGPHGKSTEQFNIEKELPYLLQKMVSAPTQNGIEATYRIIVAVATDDEGKMTQCDVLEVVQKNPMLLTVEKEKKCSKSVISLTGEAAVRYDYKKPHVEILSNTDPIYQSMARTVKKDMKKFMLALHLYDLSYFWAEKVLDKTLHSTPNNNCKLIDVTKPHEYIIHCMGKMERYRFQPCDQLVIFSLKKVIEGNVPVHREYVTNVFMSRYFSSKEHPLPNSMRTHALFQVIIDFIVTEKNIEVLKYIGKMAEETLKFHEQSETTDKDICVFLLDKLTVKRIKLIISYTKYHMYTHPFWELPYVQKPVLSSYYGPWAHIYYFVADSTNEEPPIQNDGVRLDP